jgi:hypothetical protein
MSGRDDETWKGEGADGMDRMKWDAFMANSIAGGMRFPERDSHFALRVYRFHPIDAIWVSNIE